VDPAAFLETLAIREATIARISMGGTIALVLAARRNLRNAKVASINPYNDIPAGSIRNSSFTVRLT
jgi:pimeloyl-ACP methyl ester carboxylesterase